MNPCVLGGLALLAYSTIPSAADLSECAGISDDVVRLFCYDRLAGRSQPSAPAREPAKAMAPPASTPAGPVEPAVPETAGPAPAEPAPTASDPKRIEARIVGRFEGWSKGTQFRLDNGQVWEAVGAGTHYSKLEAPKVVIERDFIGQHLMSIEGVKSRALVRRAEN